MPVIAWSEAACAEGGRMVQAVLRVKRAALGVSVKAESRTRVIAWRSSDC